MYILSNFSDLL